MVLAVGKENHRELTEKLCDAERGRLGQSSPPLRGNLQGQRSSVESARAALRFSVFFQIATQEAVRKDDKGSLVPWKAQKQFPKCVRCTFMEALIFTNSNILHIELRTETEIHPSLLLLSR